MGSDDLEAFSVARDLDVFSWDVLQVATNSQQVTLLKRWMWVSLDELVLTISSVFGQPSFLGFELGYLICATLPAIATWLALFVVGAFAQKMDKQISTDHFESIRLLWFLRLPLHLYISSMAFTLKAM